MASSHFLKRFNVAQYILDGVKSIGKYGDNRISMGIYLCFFALCIAVCGVRRSFSGFILDNKIGIALRGLPHLRNGTNSANPTR